MVFQMVTTALLGAGLIYYRATMDSRKIRPYKEKWSNLMAELDLFTKGSNSTFSIDAIEFIENGFIADIVIPTGLSYKDIEKHTEAIENSFSANITIENKDFSNICTIKFLDKELEDYYFKPVKTKEFELFVGKTYDNENYILDMNKNSHVLFLGATGKGKTIELMMVLTNLIYNSSSKIELHLSQIAKSETGMLRDCKCVQFYGTKLEDVTVDLERVAKQINSRSDIFDEECVSNIEEYNKYHEYNKMKRIYYVIEELSFFMPQPSDLEYVKELKNRCWSAIVDIVKAGRSVGVHFLSVSQRSTCTNLPSDVKSQMTRVSFAQISKVDSLNAIECENAVYLKDKQCLIYGDSRPIEIVKVPTLTNSYMSLHEFVPEIRIPKQHKEDINKTEEIKDVVVDTNMDDNVVTKTGTFEVYVYGDRKMDEDELKAYYKKFYRENSSKVDNVIYINRSNAKTRPGVIKGAMKNVNK